jgi:hypothetical protein
MAYKMFFGSLHKGKPENIIFMEPKKTHGSRQEFLDFQLKGIVKIT